MTTTDTNAPTRAGVVLLWLCGAATLLAAAMAASGGFRIDIGSLRISMHAVTRPIVVAVALGALGLWSLGAERARHEVDRGSAAIARDGLVIACAFAVIIAVATFQAGARIAGGTDSSGYLSEARLWRATGGWNLSALRTPTPLSGELTLTNRQYPFTPAGYQPAGNGWVVPGYPPGLPMLMALAGTIGGERAHFMVVPLAAGGLVVVAFLIGRRLGGPDAALVAAAAMGASPIMLYQAAQPMSDVVAAFWWALATLLLLSASTRAHAAAGCAAAIACAVRPNMFVMVPVLALLAGWWHGGGRRAWIRLAIFAAPTAIAAVLFAAFQRYLYGSAATSGYGQISSLFALEHVWPNLLRYPRWAIFTQSGLLLAALGAPLAIRRGWVTPCVDRAAAERAAWAGLLFFACLQGFYLLYIAFDDWVYFRFLLPALPLLLVLQAVAIAAACGRVPSPQRGLAVLLVAVLVASWGVGRARGLGAFRLRDSEQRYVDVADFARGLPPNAVFLSLQHSGSLSYYRRAAILRWDWIEPDELDRAVAQLSRNGHAVFAALDEWEEPQFLERFAGSNAAAAIDAPLFAAGGPPGITARVYAIRGAQAAAGAAPVSSR